MSEGSAEHCQNCPDQGWFWKYNDMGEPDQAQCQWCEVTPNSVFNVMKQQATPPAGETKGS